MVCVLASWQLKAFENGFWSTVFYYIWEKTTPIVLSEWTFFNLFSSLSVEELYHLRFKNIPNYSCLCFPGRGTCVHRGDKCRGACSGSHVAGDGEDHHQAHVWLPEELHFRWRLWMCAGGIRVGPPGPQSWAGTSVGRPSRRLSTHTRFSFHRERFIS